MAKARIIKPGFFLNEELAEIDIFGRVLFIGLWTLADKEGRLKDKPKRIKACIFPYDEVDCEKFLSELSTMGFIVRYEVSGEKYIQITKFKKHQNPHHTEKKSEIPEYSPLARGELTVNSPLTHGEKKDSHGGNPVEIEIESEIKTKIEIEKEKEINEEKEKISPKAERILSRFSSDDFITRISPRLIDRFLEKGYNDNQIIDNLIGAESWLNENKDKKQKMKSPDRFIQNWMAKVTPEPSPPYWKPFPN